MKNLGLLNKKCSGWKPSELVEYIKKCDHHSLLQRQFAEQLTQALKTIAETATPGKKVFLYNEPKNTWASETVAVYESASVLFEETSIADVSVKLSMFHPEPDYIYFLIDAKQENETVELLFLERMN